MIENIKCIDDYGKGPTREYWLFEPGDETLDGYLKMHSKFKTPRDAIRAAMIAERESNEKSDP